MRSPHTRFTVRRLMLIVGGVAAILPCAIEAGRIWASLPGRPWISRLQVGQSVIATDAASAVPPDESGTLAPGTRCAVVHESAWDDDSCYESREVTVRVLKGNRTSEVLK